MKAICGFILLEQLIFNLLGSFIFDSQFFIYPIVQYIILGVLNIIHVFASYILFEIFTSGTGNVPTLQCL